MTEDVDGPDPLSEGSRLLPIGPPKTGSTSIQAALAPQREGLPAHGAAHPGNTLRRGVVGALVVASRLEGARSGGSRATGSRATRRRQQARPAGGRREDA